ncbi:MAG: SPOR domain-containing protein [Pseudomonadota bacterium]|nr:SPOR domain-containing protein [Pseudomonadota bacterium]
MTVVKSIVACLALANMVYFLWIHGLATSQETPTPARAATLKLVAEAPPSAHPAAAGSSSEETVADAAGAAGPAGAQTAGLLTSVKRCIAVGPFRDVSEAAHAAGTLRRAGYDPRQRVVNGEVWAGLWVYLSIPANGNSGDQLLAKLKGAGIDDALQMPGPVDGSVISLGLFSEERRAQARIAQLHALGLNPGIAERKRTGNLYWVDIDLKPTDGLLNPADFQGEAGRITRLEVKACPAGDAPP